MIFTYAGDGISPTVRTTPAGSWGRTANPTYRLFICVCPTCNRAFYLSKGHALDAAGKITPSLVCPHSKCTFHVHATLGGYDGVDDRTR